MNLTQWGVNKSDLVGRVRRLEGAYPKTNHTTPVYSGSKFTLPSSSAVLPGGQINPLSAVQAKGNLSPFVLSGVIGFTSSSNSITAWWDGTNSSQVVVVKRADGTSFSVPKGSQTISNLQPSMQYGFSIYWNIQNTSGLSFGPGDSGSPLIAVSSAAQQSIINAALAAQQIFKAEPIYSGLVYFSTTAGGGGASGPGTTATGGSFDSVRVRGFQTT